MKPQKETRTFVFKHEGAPSPAELVLALEGLPPELHHEPCKLKVETKLESKIDPVGGRNPKVTEHTHTYVIVGFEL